MLAYRIVSANHKDGQAVRHGNWYESKEYVERLIQRLRILYRDIDYQLEEVMIEVEIRGEGKYIV